MCLSNQTGVMGGLRFLGQAKVVGPGGDVLARTWSKGGLAVAEVDVEHEVTRSRRVLHHPGASPSAPTPTSDTPQPRTRQHRSRRNQHEDRAAHLLVQAPWWCGPHARALAEALAALGEDVHVWTPARGGDRAFFRPVDPAVTVHAVPFEGIDGEDVGTRIVRSIAEPAPGVRPAPSRLRRRARAGLHQRQRGHAVRAHDPPPRRVHDARCLAACHERAAVEPSARICVSRTVSDEVALGWDCGPP